MSYRHKVFISFHSADIAYKEKFEKLFAGVYDIMVSKSVSDGDIGDGLKTETVRQKIRDEYLRDSTVTVVLIGKETWKRKHVDWEIASSIRNTQNNPRSGLLGIILPTHDSYLKDTCNKYIIPPRLADNVSNKFCKLFDWSEDPNFVQKKIHEAFENRFKIDPDNSRLMFGKNWSGDKWSE
jgi:hypothetical protein